MAKLKGGGKPKAKAKTKTKSRSRSKTGPKSKSRTRAESRPVPSLPPRTETGGDGELAKVVLLIVILAGLGVGVYFFVREYFTVRSVGDVEQTPSPVTEEPAGPSPPSGDQTDASAAPTEGGESLGERFEKWVGENKNWFYPVGGLVVFGVPLAYILYLLYERFFRSVPELSEAQEEVSQENSSFEAEDHEKIRALGVKYAKGFLETVSKSPRARLLRRRKQVLKDLGETAVSSGAFSDAASKLNGKLKILDIMLSGDNGSKRELREHVKSLEEGAPRG